MNNLILYSDASEKFKYKLTLEGAKIEETTSRLCLEFDSGENVYFKGKIDQNGNCVVNITALKHFEGCGKAKIEVIAEKNYFTIHEMPFEVKKKIDVKFESNKNDNYDIEVEEKKPVIGITFDKVFEKNEKNEKVVDNQDNKVKETIKSKDDSLKNFNNFFESKTIKK